MPGEEEKAIGAAERAEGEGGVKAVTWSRAGRGLEEEGASQQP